jgi:hypothetical protein
VDLARSVYDAYVAAPGSTLAARRATYLAAVTPFLERGVAALVDDMRAVEALAALFGIENAVATATRA